MLLKFLDIWSVQDTIELKYNKDINLKIYVDVDLGGNKETRRSTMGFINLYGFSSRYLVFLTITLCNYNIYSWERILQLKMNML